LHANWFPAATSHRRFNFSQSNASENFQETIKASINEPKKTTFPIGLFFLTTRIRGLSQEVVAGRALAHTRPTCGLRRGLFFHGPPPLAG